MQFFQNLLDTVLVNLLFIICCVPVVTLGAALLALNAYSLQRCREGRRPHACGVFWRLFCGNLRKGVAVSLILILLVAVLTLDFLWLLQAQFTGGDVLLGVLCGVIVLLGMTAVYLTAILSREGVTLGQAANRALLLAIVNWYRSAPLFLAGMAFVVVSLNFPGFFLTVLPLFILAGFSLFCYIKCLLIGKTLPQE